MIKLVWNFEKIRDDSDKQQVVIGVFFEFTLKVIQ